LETVIHTSSDGFVTNLNLGSTTWFGFMDRLKRSTIAAHSRGQRDVNVPPHAGVSLHT